MTDFKRAIEEAKASVMPFESWEVLPNEKGPAYSAFCAFRDYGPERSIRKAVDASAKDEDERNRVYRKWLTWSAKFHWQERTADYDRYIEKMKQGEVRKTIEAQGQVHREITGKILQVVGKKLDTMNPDDLTQNNVTEWAVAAIKMEREAAGLIATGGKVEMKQGELNFTSDFQGL